MFLFKYYAILKTTRQQDNKTTRQRDNETTRQRDNETIKL